MRVKEGASFELSDGTWDKPEIELDDSDFDRAMAEWQIPAERVDALPLSARYRVMSTLARMLLVQRQLEARHIDELWVKEQGEPMLAAVVSELKDLYRVVKDSQ